MELIGKLLRWLGDNVVELIGVGIAGCAYIYAKRSYENSLKQTAISDKALVISDKALVISEEAKVASNRSADAAEKSADMAEKMFNESYRPEIQIRLARAVGGMSSKGTIGLYIDNVGSMPSKNIKITITPKLSISFNENQIPFEEKFKQFKVEGNSHILNYDFINTKSSISEYLERSVFVNPDDTTQEYYHESTHTFEIEYYGLSELEEKKQDFRSTFTCSINTLLNMNQII